MDKPQGEPPQAGKRLTRDDVLRLIAEHGGPVGLNLEGADLHEADLGELDLHGADLGELDLHGADLSGANLQGAYVGEANLRQAALEQADLHGATLSFADLRRAYLSHANLQEATLVGSDLREAYLLRADLQSARLQQADLRRACLDMASLRDADLENANWGDYILGQEAEGNFRQEVPVYRALKQRHAEAGMYDVAGEFHYREMEARRKLAWKERRFPYALAMYALRFLYGYGERPLRVVVAAAAIVLGLALLVHWPLGTVEGGFWDALYYSAASFTALGYGASASDPQGWAGRFLGAGESFLGVFMMALFLVTFTRKMTR